MRFMNGFLVYDNSGSSGNVGYLNHDEESTYIYEAPSNLLYAENFSNPWVMGSLGSWEWLADGSIQFKDIITGASLLVGSLARTAFGDSLSVLPDNSCVVYRAATLEAYRFVRGQPVQAITLPAMGFSLVTGSNRSSLSYVGYRLSDGAISIAIKSSNVVGGFRNLVGVTEYFAPTDGATPAKYTHPGMAAGGVAGSQTRDFAAADTRDPGDAVMMIGAITSSGDSGAAFRNDGAYGVSLYGFDSYATPKGVVRNDATYTADNASVPGYTLMSFSSGASTALGVPDEMMVLIDDIGWFNAVGRTFYGQYAPPEPYVPTAFWTDFKQATEVIGEE